MNEELMELFQNLSDSFHARRFADLRMSLLDMEPADIALFMENELEDTEQIMFFRMLPKEQASDVFIEIDSDTQEKLIKTFTDKELKAVIDDMFLDDTVDVIEEMPANVVKRILKNSDPENRKQINALLEYPDDSVGSIMTTEYISFSASFTVEEAFEKIRRIGLNKETIYTCYVTDRKKHLIGVVTVKDLLLADKQDVIENVMDTAVITVETNEDKEEAVLKFSFLRPAGYRHLLHSLGTVGHHRHLERREPDGWSGWPRRWLHDYRRAHLCAHCRPAAQPGHAGSGGSLRRLPVVQLQPGQGIHGRHRFPGAGWLAGHGSGMQRFIPVIGHPRRCICGGGLLCHDSGILVQVHAQKIW